MWPFLLAISVGATAFLTVLSMHGINYRDYLLPFGPYLTYGCWGHIIATIGWLIDVGLEGKVGQQAAENQSNLRAGFKLFIVSEVIFFASFFGAFFYKKWTTHANDKGKININALLIPSINTLILFTSGVLAGWSHSRFEEKHWTPKLGRASWYIGGSLFVAILLGLAFTYLQILEYQQTTIKISDGIFGSVFYVATGFHGLHVIIGSIILIVVLLRYVFGYLNKESGTVGFDCAVWYWHFVDAVWIGLFLCVYVWGA
jgi:heme/copper-type cytochrome/quinol oxidase subunit 3